MRLVRTVAEMRQARRGAAEVGLVPTMGALHAGHSRLIETARGQCAAVVVSVFVNPAQFNERDDYLRYARCLERDAALCESLGVDLVFAPEESQMYPREQRAVVEVRRIGDHLCGRFRPGHFQGVATVVLKLLNIVEPERAYFGEKDAQQLALIRRMVADLNVPVRIVAVPTVREADGLALSSRNERLSAEERKVAVTLYRALCAARERIRAGELDAAAVRRAALEVLEAQPAVSVEYLEVVETEEMQPVERIAGPVRVAGAIRVGATRLIDNLGA